MIMVDPASGMERTAIAVKLTEVVGTGGTQRMELEGKTETVHGLVYSERHTSGILITDTGGGWAE